MVRRIYITKLPFDAGLPQVTLPRWYDLYNMAVRAEHRGIGIHGNKNVVLDIEAIEFGRMIAGLMRSGKESEGSRTRARAVAEACGKARGKGMAADRPIEITEGKE